MSALEGLANLPPGAERLAVLDSLLLGLEAIASIQGKPRHRRPAWAVT